LVICKSLYYDARSEKHQNSTAYSDYLKNCGSEATLVQKVEVFWAMSQ